MQTFLPYRDFAQSMRCLDYQRLGKQRVEAMQILQALRGQTKGWIKHPATRMWVGYEDALAEYMNCAIREWVRRGYNNTIPIIKVPWSYKEPHWLGNEEFHSSHRSALLFKHPRYYQQYGWQDEPMLLYYWPRNDNPPPYVSAVSNKPSTQDTIAYEYEGKPYYYKVRLWRGH